VPNEPGRMRNPARTVQVKNSASALSHIETSLSIIAMYFVPMYSRSESSLLLDIVVGEDVGTCNFWVLDLTPD
jgi:hypothetical protein